MSTDSRHEDRMLRAALDDLAQAGSGPDFSRSIMGRLGYMRVSPRVARRRAMTRWANRLGMIAIAAVALTLGWRVFRTSPHVRGPIDTTVPHAISRDVQQQSEQLGSMIQTIREISSPCFTPRLGAEHDPARRAFHSSGGIKGREMGGESESQIAPGAMGMPAAAETLETPDGSRKRSALPEPSSEDFEPPIDDRFEHSYRTYLPDDVNRRTISSVRCA